MNQDFFNSNVKLPSFICIGTFRAGTTWLQSILERHPGVFLPFEKETKFFSEYFYRGIEWYSNFFKDCNENKIIGEICPTYLAYPEAAERIHSIIPNARILMILRKPSDQILSLYKLAVIRGSINSSIEDAVKKEKRFIENVRYYKHISKYLNFFSNDQIYIAFYEDLKKDNALFLNGIFDFLHLPEFYPDSSKKVNEGRKPRIRLLDVAIAKSGDFLRNNNLYFLKKYIIRTGIVNLLKKINRRKNNFVTMPENTTSYIIEQLGGDIDELSNLTGRDLNYWKI